MCQTMGNPICRAHTSIKRLHQIDKPSTTTSKYKVRKLRQNQGLTIYNNNKIYTIRFHKHARKGLGPTKSRRHQQNSNRSKCLKNLDGPLKQNFLASIQNERSNRIIDHPTHAPNLVNITPRGIIVKLLKLSRR